MAKKRLTDKEKGLLLKQKEAEKRAAKDEILGVFSKLAQEKRLPPSRSDMIKAGVSRDKIRSHFGNMISLQESARGELAELGQVLFDETDFTESAHKKLQKDIKKYKNIIFTTAVVGNQVHEGFWKSLQLLAKKKKAKILILPCADPASSRGWALDSLIPKDSVIFNDLKINDNFKICSIKTSAKQLNPLTGMHRIAAGDRSCVFASPKQYLDYESVGNEKMSHAVMTTGACTTPNYHTRKYISERTAYFGHKDHILGAIIVEIADDEYYHFTQIQGEADTGYFADRGKYYMGDSGKVVSIRGDKKGPGGITVEAIVAGDWHTGDTDPQVDDALLKAAKLLKPKKFVLHDFFNGHSINHHEAQNIINQAKKAKVGRLNMDEELLLGADELNRLGKRYGKYIEEFVMIVSNHNDWLSQYLQTQDLRKHPHNYGTAIKLQSAMIDHGTDPLKAGYEIFGLKSDIPIRWMKTNEDLIVAGVQLAAHGHQGKNGKRNPTKAGLERAFGECIVGHSHTPGIFRGVFQVGTSTFLRVGYNNGPSTWVQTYGILYSNGSRQLINVINGKQPL